MSANFSSEMSSFIKNNKALCIGTLGIAIVVKSAIVFGGRSIKVISNSVGSSKKASNKGNHILNANNKGAPVDLKHDKTPTKVSAKILTKEQPVNATNHQVVHDSVSVKTSTENFFNPSPTVSNKEPAKQNEPSIGTLNPKFANEIAKLSSNLNQIPNHENGVMPSPNGLYVAKMTRNNQTILFIQDDLAWNGNSKGTSISINTSSGEVRFTDRGNPITNPKQIPQIADLITKFTPKKNEDPIIKDLADQIQGLNQLIDTLEQNYTKISSEIKNCSDEISKINNYLLTTNETIKEKKRLKGVAYEEYIHSRSRSNSRIQDPALKSKYEELEKDFEQSKLAAAPELGRLELQLANLEEQSRNLSTQQIEATKSVDLLSRQILDIQDEKQLTDVQKSALYGIPPSDKHPIDVVNAIQRELENKDIGFLEHLIRPYESQIQLLHQKEREIRDIVDAGQASRNRALISDPESPLNDPNVMLAVFAKEALETKKNPKFKDLNKITMAMIVRSVFESPMYFIELEALPPNAGEKTYQKYDEYRQRRDRKYLNKIDSLEKVADRLRVNVVHTSPIDKPYISSNWEEYAHVFEQLVSTTDKLVQDGKTNQILANRGGWTTDHIINQTRDGLSMIFKASGLKCTVNKTTDSDYLTKINEIKVEGTIDDIVNALNTSPHLLDPGISHFLDRLHLMGALVDKEACITTSDGKSYSGADILKKLVGKFTEGVNTENAIAAEQMHARIMLCMHALPK